MDNRIDMFINDQQLRIDKNAESFPDLFGIDYDELDKLIREDVSKLIQDVEPSEVILSHIREGNFAFLFCLAGMGHLHKCENALKKAKIMVGKA